MRFVDDRFLRTLLYGAGVAGAWLVVDGLFGHLGMPGTRLRGFLLPVTLGALVLLAPDRRRALRGAALGAMALVGWSWAPLAVADVALLVTGLLLVGRIGSEQRGVDGALAVSGLGLSALVAANTPVTESLALWAFFVVQALHPIVVGVQGVGLAPGEAGAGRVAPCLVLSATDD